MPLVEGDESLEQSASKTTAKSRHVAWGEAFYMMMKRPKVVHAELQEDKSIT